MLEDNEETTSARPTWGERHAVTVITAVLFSLLAMVMFIQVGC